MEGPHKDSNSNTQSGVCFCVYDVELNEWEEKREALWVLISHCRP